MTKILGPLPCIGCRKLVFWDRSGAELRLMNAGKRKPTRHDCDEWRARKAA